MRKGKLRGSHLDLNPGWHHFSLLARAGLAQSVERKALNPTDLSNHRFGAAGPLFGVSRVQIFQKGVQPDMKCKVFVFQSLDPFWHFKGPNLPKRGPTRLEVQSVRFPGAGPLFGLSEVRILQKGVQQDMKFRLPDPSKRGPAEPDVNTPRNPTPFSFFCRHLKTLFCLLSEASVPRGACQERQSQRQPS